MHIFDILKSTPYYVYPLFCYLMFIGIKATRPRAISKPKKLFITPSIFLLFCLKTISNIEDFLLLILIIAISFFINYKLLKSPAAQINDNVTIIPGSWQPLLTIICIFLVKYYFGYLKSVMPEIAKQYSIIDLAISGIILGITFYKAYFYYKYSMNKIKK